MTKRQAIILLAFTLIGISTGHWQGLVFAMAFGLLIVAVSMTDGTYRDY